MTLYTTLSIMCTHQDLGLHVTASVTLPIKQPHCVLIAPMHLIEQWLGRDRAVVAELGDFNPVHGGPLQCRLLHKCTNSC